MNFAAPDLTSMDWVLRPGADLPWLLLLPAVLALLWWLDRRAGQRLAAALGGRESALVGRRVLPRVRLGLAAFAASALAVALLRPVVAGAGERPGPDVVLCVDVSRSMLAADVAPSRFGALQAQVHAALVAAEGSRVALLAFAGEARLCAPLTADRAAIGWLCDELAPGVLHQGGTDLAGAITAAEQLLEGAHTRGDIVLLTDGEDPEQRGADAAQAARERGHRVHTLGFGTVAGSKIVLGEGPTQRFLQDASGRDVLTRLEVDALHQLAQAGDGRFVLGDVPDALLALWRDDLQPAAARRRLQDPDGGGAPAQRWWLFAGFVAWLLRLMLPERRA